MIWVDLRLGGKGFIVSTGGVESKSEIILEADGVPHSTSQSHTKTAIEIIHRLDYINSAEKLKKKDAALLESLPLLENLPL